jgi:DNA-binding transcriptional LysR family regulator
MPASPDPICKIAVMNWDALKVFLAVARAGQLLGAARKLGIDQSTVSRQIASLESDLRSKLFERHTSGVSLTPAGERLVSIAERMEADAALIEETIAERDTDAVGTVRVGAPDVFGSVVLAPLLARLAIDHPGLHLQLVPLPRHFSLAKREVDIAVTVARPVEGNLYARKLTDYTLGLHGARAYVDEVGTIASVEDLSRCLFVTYVQDLIFSPELDYGKPYLEKAGQVLECASAIGQMQAVRTRGVGFLHHYALPQLPDMVPILPELNVQLSYWLVGHADVKGFKRLSLVQNAILEEVTRLRSTFRASRELEVRLDGAEGGDR